MASHLFKMKTVLAAIIGSGGNVTFIATRLGCTWATAKAYIDKWDTTVAAYDAEIETMLDDVENVVLTAARDENNLTAAFFLLNNRGKHRGYGQNKLTVGGASAGRIDMTIEFNNEDPDEI